MRKATGFLVVLGGCLAWAVPAQAAFHVMRVSEVLAQWHGDPRIQFVELTLASAGQNQVGGHKIIFQAADGTKTGEVGFGGAVASGANGATILIGTAAFQAAFGVVPDLMMPEGLMAPFAGRVCFDSIDCVAYGAFTGANTGLGTPAPGFPVDGGESLTLKTVTPPGAGRDNSANYEFRVPTPKNNAGQAGTVPAFACFITDPLTDASKWDEPTGGAGIDLTSCGQEALLDVGKIDVAAGVLALTPGEFAFPGIGPLGLTGLKNAVASTIPNDNYRLRFTLLANPGIVVGAVFVRQHYDFDEAQGVFDIGAGFGFGLNFSFDDLNNEASDHGHGDLRTNCFQDPDFDNEDDAPFPDFKMTSNAEYDLVMDVDGDDEVGPLTLQVKLYPAEQAEPVDYLATFKLADVAARLGGIDHGDASFDHALLLAAIGSSEASLEFSNFAICPIPRNQKHVRCLVCARQDDGSVVVTWDNPFDAEDSPITVRVNGAVAGTAGGNDTSFTIASPPDGELAISVTNYSGVATTCTVCENNPPVAVIDAPEQVMLQDGTATFALDSASSTDGDGDTQTLSRFWEITAAPGGGNATLDDPAAAIVNVNVNINGEYKFQLTLSDNGCLGDAGQSTVTLVTVVVGEVTPPGGGQKPGDENQDGKLDLSDPVSILNHLFLGTNPSLPCGDGTAGHPANVALLDSNGDGKLDLSDAVSVLSFLFLGGVQPANCSEAACPCIRVVDCPDKCEVN